MTFDERFLHVLPSLTETFSHGDEPCYSETPIGPAPPRGSCPFRPECDATRSKLLNTLGYTYGRRVKITCAEISSSIVVRAEHLFNQMENRRLTLRKHLYELVSVPGDASRDFPYGCNALEPQERCGEYLGFMDLRPVFDDSPLAMALLAPPARMRVDGRTLLITGSYGRVFAGPEFNGSVYVTYDRSGGACCAQACVMMVLGALLDRRVVMSGSYTLTYVAKNAGARPVDTGGADCLGRVSGGGEPPKAFEVGGLTPPEMCGLLRQSGASAAVFWTPPGKEVERLILHFVEGSVLARFPAILLVNSKTLWGKFFTEDAPEHAVTIVGLRWLDQARRHASLIAHDPGLYPYDERPFEDFMKAASDYLREGEPLIQVVFSGDARIKTHAFECYKALEGTEAGFEIQQAALGTSPFVPNAGGPQDGTSPSRWLAIRLLAKHEIVGTFIERDPLAKTPRWGCLKDVLGKLPHARFWCFAIGCDEKVRCLHLFDAETSLEEAGFAYWTLVPSYDDPKSSSLDRQTGRSFDHGGLGPMPVAAEGARPAATQVTAAPGTGDAEAVRPKEPPLQCSVLTSCSPRPLRGFVEELSAVHAVKLFDLFLLRDIDIDEMREAGVQLPPAREELTPADILADHEGIPRVSEWLAAQLPEGVRIAALATYLPAITSLNQTRRDPAVRALAGSLLVARKLVAAGRMEHAIVEAVCGTVLDPCPCARCRPASRVFVSRREEKLDLLMASLKQAVGMMPDENLPDARFAIALELEPGRVYVLNEFNWLKEACARIRADGLLARHVGVNLDLAHARIAGVQPGDLAGLEDRLVHAHIADHPPAMHTRDQALGAWTALDQGGGSYRPFLQILARRPSQSGLPFSRAVALELEGAHRMKWIRDSIAGLRHLLTACR